MIIIIILKCLHSGGYGDWGFCNIWCHDAVKERGRVSNVKYCLVGVKFHDFRSQIDKLSVCFCSPPCFFVTMSTLFIWYMFIHQICISEGEYIVTTTISSQHVLVDVWLLPFVCLKMSISTLILNLCSINLFCFLLL